MGLTEPSFLERMELMGLTESRAVTNGDRIRRMTDDELAEFLLNRDLDVVKQVSKAFGFIYKVDREQCLVNVIDWLKQEAANAP